MQVGDIVWFDPNKPNVWGAFYDTAVEVVSPFKVKIGGIMEDGALNVTPVPDGGAPDRWLVCYQLVQESQLSKDFPDEPSVDEPTADILWLIEQLEWLAVEQKVIGKETLLKIYGAIANGN